MRAKLMTIPGCLALLTAAITAAGQARGPSANIGGAPPALALVILYDGSGSMADRVPNLSGVPTPKYQLANNAVTTIAQKMENYCTNKHVTMDAGLIYFTQATVKVGIPFQQFQARRFEDWARNFKSPAGGTPLGEGIKEANKMLAMSHAIKKHILIVTDGESNQGETPQAVLARMKSAQDSTSIYFVAFDVSAKVFDPVKKLGATVVSAANEKELKTEIDSLLGKKILLESE
ncbi:MAG: vWA domain-containing protein [Verrucomicrobiota bacterium]